MGWMKENIVFLEDKFTILSHLAVFKGSWQLSACGTMQGQELNVS